VLAPPFKKLGSF